MADQPKGLTRPGLDKVWSQSPETLDENIEDIKSHRISKGIQGYSMDLPREEDDQVSVEERKCANNCNFFWRDEGVPKLPYALLRMTDIVLMTSDLQHTRI